MDDHELEQVLRDGLKARAATTDVSRAEGLLPDPAVRRGWRTPLLAAAAVLVLIGAGLGVPLLLNGDGETGQVDRGDPPVATDSTPDLPSDGEWRTEYWGALAVDVPADWGFGGAPHDSGGSTVACWPAAMVTASGKKLRNEDPTMGWVGRPISLTDVCQMYPNNNPNAGAPEAPYVWLGADVEPGSVDLGDGFVQETVLAEGETLTVGSTDGALRQRILDSARAGDLCAPQLALDTQVWSSSEADVEAATMSVCAYRASEGERAESATLSTGFALVGQRVEDYLAALASGRSTLEGCTDVGPGEYEWVVMELRAEEGDGIRRDVAHLGRCPALEVDATGLRSGSALKLTPAMVRPWAVNGIPATVYGPTGGMGAMIESFIGPQG